VEYLEAKGAIREMDEQTGSAREVAALTRLGDLFNTAYAADRAQFKLDPADQARLDHIQRDTIPMVRANPPAADNAAALDQVRGQAVWLWGLLLQQGNSIRAASSDAAFEQALGDLAWLEDSVQTGTIAADGTLDGQPVTHCARCHRRVPGRGAAVCASCQLLGYHICDHCRERVAGPHNPYCDTCAEEIVGAG
jgi:hypothetical protein